MKEMRKQFAQLTNDVETPPPADAIALGHLMREWLEATVANGGTSVSTGCGLGGYDLWAQMGDAEYLVTIKKGRDLPKGGASK